MAAQLGSARVRGRAGAEAQAWQLSLELEAAAATGDVITGAALDWAKAFDLVPIAHIRAAMMAAGVPGWAARPVLAAYAAPRRLRVAGAQGDPWFPERGILPGCGLAVFVLSVMLRPLVVAAAALDHSLRVRLYVDDLTLWIRSALAAGADAASVLQEALRLIAAFAAAAGWELSCSKSVLWSTAPAVRQLLAIDAAVPVGTRFRDLGVIAVTGGRRAAAVAPARLLEARRRLQRISWLPVPFARRCRLGAASATAVGTYGATCGRPPAGELAGLRAAAKAAVLRGHGRAAAEVVFGLLSPAWRLDCAAVVVLAPVLALARALREVAWTWPRGGRLSTLTPRGPAEALGRRLPPTPAWWSSACLAPRPRSCPPSRRRRRARSGRSGPAPAPR